MSLVAWAVVPSDYGMVLSDPNIRLLCLFAIFLLGVYGIISPEGFLLSISMMDLTSPQGGRILLGNWSIEDGYGEDLLFSDLFSSIISW